MIRVSKSSQIPISLLVDNCSSYDGQDVQGALIADQHEKCYLCEQKVTKSFHIEHFKAQAGYPYLKFAWTNLFLACGYCNGRKPNGFDMLSPIENDIEDIIVQRLNLFTKSADIASSRTGVQEGYTVNLLDKLFNGKNKLRDKRTEILYNDLEREMVFFLGLLNDYRTIKSPENKQKIINNLLITKEFLAFKYWQIKDNDDLYNEFKSYMAWNKVIILSLINFRTYI